MIKNPKTQTTLELKGLMEENINIEDYHHAFYLWRTIISVKPIYRQFFYLIFWFQL